MEINVIEGLRSVRRELPDWAEWHPSRSYTVGLEEEVMLLEPGDWGLAHEGEHVLAGLPPALAEHVAAETHQATIELATSPHASAADAAGEAGRLRAALTRELAGRGLRAASAGTHPLALWTDTRVSNSARYQLVYESMRELARREPTFALHVHIGVGDPDSAMTLQNRLRLYLPLLLALSANSPFWQARDTGLASARTPVFQAFPRVGIPRRFHSYGDYVEAVDQLLRCQAFPAPTFLWWDVRLQPSLGTVEVRVMDAQVTAADTGALAGLVQAIAHLELEQGYVRHPHVLAEEVIHENRFLAARDGLDARFIDPIAERRISGREWLHDLLRACRGHAQQLGCEEALDRLADRDWTSGADRQRRLAAERELGEVIEFLAGAFSEPAHF